VGLLASGLLALAAHPALGWQAAKPMPVNIATADKVTLSANFYPGAKGEGSPVVILLHGFGEDSSKAEWQNLATALQKHGFAVMRFDFRGCGNSTAVEPGKPNPMRPDLSIRGFWDEKENAFGVRGMYLKGKGAARTEEIDFKNFEKKAYYRILANDIEAVKTWLDSSGQCDTSKTILIGAKEGATIGALWLNSAWNCYRLKKTVNMVGQPVLLPDLANPQGQNVKAAIWLSPSPMLGETAANVAGMLYKAGGENKTPMLFFYGEGDKTKATAAYCEKYLTAGNKKKFPLTAAVKVQGAAKVSGSTLLLESLGLPKSLPRWIDDALASNAMKGPPAKATGGLTEQYVWIIPRAPRPRPARVEGTPLFFNFLPFYLAR
jgi:pimeloyl-ACP methyl ester carboxylesterase